jgi:uncharacterized protein YvpB
MNIPIKKDESSGEFYIDILDLEKIFDNTSEIEYYTIEEVENQALMLNFFNKNNEKVKLNLK